MNRLHGFIKVYHASSTTKFSLPEHPSKQQPNSAKSPGQTGSSSQRVNMENPRAVLLSFAALIFLCTISLCHGRKYNHLINLFSKESNDPVKNWFITRFWDLLGVV